MKEKSEFEQNIGLREGLKKEKERVDIPSSGKFFFLSFFFNPVHSEAFLEAVPTTFIIPLSIFIYMLQTEENLASIFFLTGTNTTTAHSDKNSDLERSVFKIFIGDNQTQSIQFLVTFLFSLLSATFGLGKGSLRKPPFLMDWSINREGESFSHFRAFYNLKNIAEKKTQKKSIDAKIKVSLLDQSIKKRRSSKGTLPLAKCLKNGVARTFKPGGVLDGLCSVQFFLAFLGRF